MPSFSASAPGKIILFGEHAVVYGQPAIAVPVTQVRARATVSPNIQGNPGEVRIQAAEIGLDSSLEALPPGDPIRETVMGVMTHLGVDRIPACTLKVNSSIPVASGLGSGAAVAAAIIRALAGFIGYPMGPETVSKLAYEVEKIHHGTPSGIDNTVVSYAQAVYFVRGEITETFQIGVPFTIIIGDTGISSPTKETVGDVRRAWENDRAGYERLFRAVGSITRTARQAIERGTPGRLGPLMDENQALLQEMGVSSPELERLAAEAKAAGALGVKLSGGGRGGNMIALAAEGQAEEVAQALRRAGAVNTIITRVGAPE